MDDKDDLFCYFVTDRNNQKKFSTWKALNSGMPKFFLKEVIEWVRKCHKKVLVEFAASGSDETSTWQAALFSRGSHMAVVMSLTDGAVTRTFRLDYRSFS
jgi:hypothetical protein